ncbi:ImmA/IrrE family metallo-endopeptidase [Amycolatopsis taiwanensis]|nr:ImmA/IrrE family metallo-endopeptidase [Amycolatopsis taiwanensis]
MITVLERRHPGALVALRESPLNELGKWPDVVVELVSERDGGSWCSVAGSYRDDTEPPTLVVGASRSYRRRGFTGLHELGHHLQQTDPGLGQRLFAYQDSEAFEDAACDAFAARVLLPDDRARGVIDGRGPTAPGVVDLFRSSQASREACCVRAAEYLTGAGVVTLLDATGTVIFAAPRGMVPPARGSDQSATPLITAALRASATVERDNTFVTFRNGATSDTLYGQAAWCDQDYLVAVLVSDNAAWRPFALPRPDTARSRFGSWWTCETETCSEIFQITEPACTRCGIPRCPSGHCGCTSARAQKDRLCDTCFLKWPPSRFDGSSPTCRTCVEESS